MTTVCTLQCLVSVCLDSMQKMLAEDDEYNGAYIGSATLKFRTF